MQPIEVRIGYRDHSGVEQAVPAYVVDSAPDGVGLQLRVPLAPQLLVSIAPTGRAPDASDICWQPTARVRWCRALAGGVYRAGLQFEVVQQAAGPQASEPVADDYYELMQISPAASPEVIHRVYRILAQQWHPDNRETGDAAAFRALNAAYHTLGDPVSRAAYDQQHEAARRHRWRIFDSPQSTHGVEAERRKRLGILRALYAKRLNECSDPEMRAQELEQLLGVSREHLEFPLWFLKERGFLLRTDNNRYLITAKGVEYTESLEELSIQSGLTALAGRLLPSPEGSRP